VYNIKKEVSMTIYDFSARDMDDEEKSLKDYKGKVLLIVNTASK
jgi:glutathione peroxidase